MVSKGGARNGRWFTIGHQLDIVLRQDHTSMRIEPPLHPIGALINDLAAFAKSDEFAVVPLTFGWVSAVLRGLVLF